MRRVVLSVVEARPQFLVLGAGPALDAREARRTHERPREYFKARDVPDLSDSRKEPRPRLRLGRSVPTRESIRASLKLSTVSSRDLATHTLERVFVFSDGKEPRLTRASERILAILSPNARRDASHDHSCISNNFQYGCISEIETCSCGKRWARGLDGADASHLSRLATGGDSRFVSFSENYGTFPVSDSDFGQFQRTRTVRGFPEHHRSSSPETRLDHSQKPTEL